MGGHDGIPSGVHVMLEHEGRVFMMRRAGTGFFDGLWSLPGGHVEQGESLRDTAIRELIEETGVHVAAQDLDYLGVVHRQSDTNRIDFFFRATQWRGEPAIREADKCDAQEWFTRATLPQTTVPYVREALFRDGAGWFFESGFKAQRDQSDVA